MLTSFTETHLLFSLPNAMKRNSWHTPVAYNSEAILVAGRQGAVPPTCSALSCCWSTLLLRHGRFSLSHTRRAATQTSDLAYLTCVYSPSLVRLTTTSSNLPTRLSWTKTRFCFEQNICHFKYLTCSCLTTYSTQVCLIWYCFMPVVPMTSLIALSFTFENVTRWIFQHLAAFMSSTREEEYILYSEKLRLALSTRRSLLHGLEQVSPPL